MQSAKRRISPFLYFILLSSLTNLIFLLIGIGLLALCSVKLSGPVFPIVVFFLIWKGGLVGFVTWVSHKNANNKDFLVKFIGIYFGRFFGIFIGGILGYEFSDITKQLTIIGFIVGALIFYFAGRWVGSKVSVLVAAQLDKVFAIPEFQIMGEVGEHKSGKRLASVGIILYAVIFPFLFVVMGLLMSYFEVPTGYLHEMLPISRLVAIVLSILLICLPWLMKNRWLEKYQTTTSSPESVVYWLGSVFSIVPVLYGFLLFVAMGTSIVELCIYAIASSIAAVIWHVHNKVSVKPNMD